MSSKVNVYRNNTVAFHYTGLFRKSGKMKNFFDKNFEKVMSFFLRVSPCLENGFTVSLLILFIQVIMSLIPFQLARRGFELMEKIGRNWIRLSSTNLLTETRKVYQQRLQET